MGTREDITEMLTRFLGESKGGGVACLVGKWGCGKTHLWREIEGSLAKNKVRTAYVSLFGLVSIAEVRSAVFNAATLDVRGDEDEKKTLSNLRRARELFFKGWPHLLQAVDHKFGIELFSKSMDLTRLLSPETVVCLDDVERGSEKLRVDEVLGFANTLAERQGCRLLLIMNEEHLESRSGDQAALARAYRERVVSRHVRLDSSLPFLASTVTESRGLRVDAATREVVVAVLQGAGCENVRTLIRVLEALDDLRSAIGESVPIDDVRLLSALTCANAEGAMMPSTFYDFHPIKFGIPEKYKDADTEAQRKFHSKYFDDAPYAFNQLIFDYVRDGYLKRQAYKERYDERIGRSEGALDRLLRRIDQSEFRYLSELESRAWLEASAVALETESKVPANIVDRVFTVASMVASMIGEEEPSRLIVAGENALEDAGTRLDRSFDRSRRHSGGTAVPAALQQKYDEAISKAMTDSIRTELMSSLLDRDVSAWAHLAERNPQAVLMAALELPILSELHATMERDRGFWFCAVESLIDALSSCTDPDLRERMGAYFAIGLWSTTDRADLFRIERFARKVYEPQANN